MFIPFAPMPHLPRVPAHETEECGGSFANDRLVHVQRSKNIMPLAWQPKPMKHLAKNFVDLYKFWIVCASFPGAKSFLITLNKNVPNKAKKKGENNGHKSI